MTELSLIEQLGSTGRAGYLDLVHIGSMTRSFEWMGHTFTIRTLRIEEEIAIGQLIKPYAGSITEEKAAVTAIAAACIETIDGNPVVVQLQRDPVVHLQEKYKALSTNWFWPVVKKINEEYMVLQQEMTKVIEETANLSVRDQIQNSPDSIESLDPLNVPDF